MCPADPHQFVILVTRNRSKGLVKRLDFSKFILPKANVLDYTDILINIRKIIRSINLESKRIDKQYGISIPQYLCLNFLNTREIFRATAKEISIHLNLNASTVSGLTMTLHVYAKPIDHCRVFNSKKDCFETKTMTYDTVSDLSAQQSAG
ncbi:MAG: hypothetical protein ABR84_00460 [Cryomorphaceae bacterium BACL21 MAG-121220-bin10]|jgi:hypothetical protein|nr:MAG: hypothetical protein ABR84_00460 [Cryomorphaceae bacterium BACL21 MAG-121220-bin10]